MFCAACHQPISTATAPCPSCQRPVLIGGRYLLVATLGQGASGTTWRARDVSEPRAADVAIKELSVARARSLKAIELFERECRTLEALNHDGIPRFIADFTVEGPGTVSLYLVQELIDGAPLKVGAFDERQVLDLVASLCDVLAWLHDRRPPVIHRDIKPSNIMRRKDGRLVLIDFGSVRHAISDASLGGSTVAGTFGYMAPEQLRGLASSASDLYAVGATALALLSGRDAASLVDPIRPSSWRADMPMSPALADFIAQLLEPDHTTRISSAREVARLARDLLNNLDNQDKYPNLTELLTSKKSRNAPPSAPPPSVPSTTLSPGVGTSTTLAGTDIARSLDRDLNLLRRHDRWVFAERGAILLAPVIATPILFWGGMGLSYALDGTSMELTFGQLVLLFAALIALGLGWAFRRRHVARTAHPWLMHPVALGLQELWSDTDSFAPQVRAAFLSLSSHEDYERLLDQVRRQYPSDLRLVPIIEARAHHFHRKKQHAGAAEHLKSALATLERNLDATSPLLHMQRHRYATLMWSSTGHRDAALRLRADAEAALRSLEQESGTSRHTLVSKALATLSPLASRPAHIDPTARGLFRFRVRRFALNALPGPGRWANAILLAFLSALIGVFVGMIATLVLTSFGVFGPPPVDDPPIGTAMLVSAGTLFALGTLLGLSAERDGPESWRDLYPDFDSVWPSHHPQRARLIEALERIWRAPIAGRGPASAAVVELEKAMRLDDFEALLARFDDPTPRKSPKFSPQQELDLAELHTFRSWYNEAVLENLSALSRIPIRDTKRRIILLEAQADRALSAKLTSVAREALDRANALRRIG